MVRIDPNDNSGGEKWSNSGYILDPGGTVRGWEVSRMTPKFFT